ncbi:hypothetical protein EMIHUDRAFT_215332 [Emiliania huxleyi CCMP1516]|uniref:RUN domain-containing protein n=2 Tax=Emiliania huxleyi TaxID=2903 RepID=A0A0D3IH77_EMIH1|nr:hypothetical protein EMIHUDRAFT_215332 [Emiliania huxleyi CCMP1516]EOD10612.1 hypothetical protein EMIHUDRAFT_215332 [Emiliania huxleyi CCMP1516]|eukprot:XP_005763041.1 hypothetical protein EMIHUDRAFT_215332 [Emiliania huxleyi CCMP1516]
MQATAAIEALLSRLAACVDDVVERARSGAELREGEAEGMCAALEELLAHRFKRRQFLLFSVHPWSLAEHAEALSSAAAVRIGVARQTGSTDSARLRAWLYLLLNRRELAAEVDALLTPELCSLMYTRGAALLGSAERDRLVRTLKPLAALRFRLGASAGLLTPPMVSPTLLKATRGVQREALGAGEAEGGAGEAVDYHDAHELRSSVDESSYQDACEPDEGEG